MAPPESKVAGPQGRREADIETHGITNTPSYKLLEKTNVAFIKQSDVINAVLEHRYALGSHAESEARDALGVVPNGAKHVGMHHSGAEDFNPAALLAHAASCAGAYSAGDVNFRAWLGEREITRPEAKVDMRPIVRVGPREQRSFQFGERNMLIDI